MKKVGNQTACPTNGKTVVGAESAVATNVLNSYYLLLIMKNADEYKSAIKYPRSGICKSHTIGNFKRCHRALYPWPPPILVKD
jgi:hypothetical protein